jgi:hypothetical protein
MSSRPKRLLCAAVGGGLAVVLAACSSNSNPPATTTTTTAARSPSTSPSAAAGSTTSTSSGTSVTSGTLAPQTATSTEFVSPSANISCEIDSDFGAQPQALTQTLCLTFNPARSVVLKTDGTLTECSGQDCLSNAGLNTPTLAYGQSITLGPFTCQSSTAGITCTLQSGAGFLIAKSGITPQGSATVTSS